MLGKCTKCGHDDPRPEATLDHEQTVRVLLVMNRMTSQLFPELAEMVLAGKLTAAAVNDCVQQVCEAFGSLPRYVDMTDEQLCQSLNNIINFEQLIPHEEVKKELGFVS